MSRNFRTIFLHGLESSSRGTKAVFFKKRVPDILIPDFSGNLRQRLDLLEKLTADSKDLLLIGSSYGGMLAAAYTTRHPEKVSRLLFFAPALNFPEYTPYKDTPIMAPTTIYIGSHDTVTPAEAVAAIARSQFHRLDFHVVDDDHLLHKTFSTLDYQPLYGPGKKNTGR